MTSSRLTYANVASTLALVLVIGGGGTAVAATAVAKNSVGPQQIRTGAVKNADLAKNAVTSKKVKDNALTGADIKESSLGEVPTATHADSATVAGRASNLLFAAVARDGTLDRASSAAVSSTRLATGVYQVTFGRDVSTCLPLAASGKIGSGTPARRIVRTASLAGNPEGIYLDLADAADVAADGGFVLYLVC